MCVNDLSVNGFKRTYKERLSSHIYFIQYFDTSLDHLLLPQKKTHLLFNSMGPTPQLIQIATPLNTSSM